MRKKSCVEIEHEQERFEFDGALIGMVEPRPTRFGPAPDGIWKSLGLGVMDGRRFVFGRRSGLGVWFLVEQGVLNGLWRWYWWWRWHICGLAAIISAMLLGAAVY
jgi:hypothetical protein